MSRILNSEPNIRKIHTLVPKNEISYRMYPPYFSFEFYQQHFEHIPLKNSIENLHLVYTLRDE